MPRSTEIVDRPLRTGRKRGLLVRLLASRRGSTAVEFAVAAPVLFLFLFGVFEFGRLFWTRNSLQFAVEESGRYAMVNNTASDDQISAYVLERLPGLNADDVQVHVHPEAVGVANFVTITATMQFRFATQFLDYSPIMLTGRSRVPRDP